MQNQKNYFHRMRFCLGCQECALVSMTFSFTNGVGMQNATNIYAVPKQCTKCFAHHWVWGWFCVIGESWFLMREKISKKKFRNPAGWVVKKSDKRNGENSCGSHSRQAQIKRPTLLLSICKKIQSISKLAARTKCVLFAWLFCFFCCLGTLQIYQCLK